MNRADQKTRRDRLYALGESDVLVLDGAAGTMLQQRKPAAKPTPPGQQGNHDLLVLTDPGTVREMHRAYLEAGAHIIETNTFGANGITQRDYGMEDRVFEMNAAAARIAREAAAEAESRTGIPRFVAGSIGPTSKSTTLPPRVSDPEFREVTFRDLLEVYRVQISGLIEGGADLLLFETCFDALNCKAGLAAAAEECARTGISLPLMVSVTAADSSGRTLTGQTLEAFFRAVEPYGLFSFGVNCSFGAAGLLPHVQSLAGKVSCRLSVYPNAGLPDAFGSYTQSVEAMRDEILPFLEQRLVHIIGGCCGTTPDHIRMISAAAGGIKPPPVLAEERASAFSGLEELSLKPGALAVAGERTNTAGSRRFARLVKQEDWDGVMETALSQIRRGAQILDLCMDDAMLDGKKALVSFLRRLPLEPEIARVPVMIDSSRWEIIEAGVEEIQGKGLINSLSLKEGEAEFLKKARFARSRGAAVVVMLFDETGQADTVERRIEIARRSCDLLTEQAGIPPRDIIIDPNVLAVATGMEAHDRYALDVLEAVSWIKEHLPGVLVSGGISNLSFSFRGNQYIRDALHAVFLHHALQRGLDMAIADPGSLKDYVELPGPVREAAEDLIFCRGEHPLQRLIDAAEEADRGAGVRREAAEQEDWRSLPVDQRLITSILTGTVSFLAEDLEEARKVCTPAASIIEGPLMEGMNQVGSLFGRGKLFLPQVVKSARVMQEAAMILEPFIAQEMAGPSSSSGKILLATVKGDVHDIGKNLVSVVLRCSRYEVTDLGVMVPAEDIADAVQAHAPDILGLSGLISPSLDEMIHVAALLEERDLSLPMMIGGAAASEAFVRQRIQPVTSAPVTHVKDASLSIQAASALLAGERQPGSRKSPAEPAAIRPLEECRRESEAFLCSGSPAPDHQGIFTLEGITLADIEPFINWRMVPAGWKVPAESPEAEKILEEARTLFARLSRDGDLTPKAAAGLFPVRRFIDDVVVYAPLSDQEQFEAGDAAVPLGVLHFLRRQEEGKASLSLADFLLPSWTGGGNLVQDDYLGMFAVTAGPSWQERADWERSRGNEYPSLMTAMLADRTAEACAEYLHMRIRREWWGYAPDEALDAREMIRGTYRGIRPAVGYPVCPDHTEKQTIFSLLNAREFTGISLTETMAMTPPASVCGYCFAAAEARYFSLGVIGEDQLEDYAGRKGWSMEEAQKWLSPHLQPGHKE